MQQFSMAGAAAEIMEVGRRLLLGGLIAGHDGNISVRLNEQEILVTPAGRSKGDLQPAELLLVDMEGRMAPNAAAVGLKPTSELPMHLAIYQQNPQVRAVVHAHSPFATAFAAAGRTLQGSALPEVTECLGNVPLLPFAKPGTQELAAAVGEAAKLRRAALLAAHGSVAWGADLRQAYYRIEELELACKIEFLASFLGKNAQ